MHVPTAASFLLLILLFLSDKYLFRSGSCTVTYILARVLLSEELFEAKSHFWSCDLLTHTNLHNELATLVSEMMLPDRTEPV